MFAFGATWRSMNSANPRVNLIPLKCYPFIANEFEKNKKKSLKHYECKIQIKKKTQKFLLTVILHN